MHDKDFGGLRVLVVDDQEFALNHSKRILNKLGITHVDTVTSGQLALSFLDNTDVLPQLIISDINMPDMDGVALLRHLGLRAGIRELKFGIVFVSGVDKRILEATESLGKSHNLYVLGSLQKPMKSEPLAEILATFEINKDTARTPFAEPVTESELLAGIESDAIVLVYQPKVSIKDKKMTGVEALARWKHPERGILGPATFIPLAESLNKIDELTQNVLRQAVAQGGRWIREGFEIGISVNYSAGSLQQLILPEHIASIARESGMKAELITVEVTESLVVQEFATTIEVLTRLRLLGIGLSLDDFGTGHASMERLQQIPFTELKLDRAYVCDATTNATSRTILETSAALGRGLGMKLVAEGVEDQAGWDLVAELGCDEVQGYFVAKPMPGEEIIAWKQQWENP